MKALQVAECELQGQIPRNEFNNVYLFQPSMCPKGAIHLRTPNLMQVALEMGKDSVPAIVGFHFKRGHNFPM